MSSEKGAQRRHEDAARYRFPWAVRSGSQGRGGARALRARGKVRTPARTVADCAARAGDEGTGWAQASFAAARTAAHAHKPAHAVGAATTSWETQRDRGEVASKAHAPVGESTWIDVRMKWLRKSGAARACTYPCCLCFSLHPCPSIISPQAITTDEAIRGCGAESASARFGSYTTQLCARAFTKLCVNFSHRLLAWRQRTHCTRAQAQPTLDLELEASQNRKISNNKNVKTQPTLTWRWRLRSEREY